MKKIASEFPYDGLGFPVILLNFPLIVVRGIQVPDINYNLLQKNVLLALSRKPIPLIGNEVRFIRQYLQMTYTEFTNKFGITHAIVIHWEKSKNTFAKIQPATELCIRLSILDTLKAKDKLFRETIRNFDYLKHKIEKNKTADVHITLDLNSLTI